MKKKLVNQFGSIVPKKVTNAYNTFSIENAHCEFLMIYLGITGDFINSDIKKFKMELSRFYENEPNKKLATHLKNLIENRT